MGRGSAESTLELSTSDAVRLHVYRWLPDAPEEAPRRAELPLNTDSTPAAEHHNPKLALRAVLVVVHGILEHAGRYAELARSLNRAGIAVWAVDLRGHGRSSGSRAWAAGFDNYLDDVSVVVREVRANYPELPLFLLGHSMGGLIVLQERLTSMASPAGLILSAPAFSVADQFLPWLRKLAAFGSKWFPRLRVARLGCSSMSRDPQVIADFRADTRAYHGRIPTRTGAEIIRVGEATRNRAADVRLPLLILQGTADAVVGCQATEDFYRAAGSGDKTLRLYPGLYHDLPREPEKKEIWTEIAQWILARC